MFWVWNFQIVHSNLLNSTFFSAISVYVLPKTTVAVFPVQIGSYSIPTAGSHSLLSWLPSSICAGRESQPEADRSRLLSKCLRVLSCIDGEDDVSPSTVYLQTPRYASPCSLKPAKDGGLSPMPATAWTWMCVRDHEMLWPWWKQCLNAMLLMFFHTQVSKELEWASAAAWNASGGGDVSSGML